MTPEFHIVVADLQKAVCPEDVFGTLHGNTRMQEDQLKHVFRALTKTIHPDLNDDCLEAQQAFQQLNEFNTVALERLAKGTYGDRMPISSRVPITIKGYTVKQVLAIGDIADIRLAQVGKTKERVVIKAARNRIDNDLLTVEQTVLKALQDKLSGHLHASCMPKLLDSFLLDDGSILPKRRVNVLNHLTGFYNGEEIRQRITGVDTRTAGWMWRRMLTLLDWVHHIGYIHGAILPPHVMFYPDNDGNTDRDERKHSIRLVDWCYAVNPKLRSKLSCWVPEYADFYPPEVTEKKKITQQTDLYMAAKTMLYLLGGDVKTNRFPDTVHKTIQSSFLRCLEKDSSKRPQDDLVYCNEFTETLKQVFGKPAWHDFNLPTKA